MQVAVLLILVGWAACFASLALWVYAVVVAIAVHLRVLMYEVTDPRQDAGHDLAGVQGAGAALDWAGPLRRCLTGIA